MKKKSLITMVVALCLVAALGVGATLAYFTDKDEATNVVTMGHVDISLFETKAGDEKPVEVKGLEFENVMPGQVLAKDPTVRVEEGSADCFVRVKAEFTGDFAAKLTAVDKAALLNKVSTDDWKKANDGYFYYKAKMSAGNTATLFSEVEIPATWGNAYAGASFNIVLTAEAIQADYIDLTRDSVNENWTDAEVAFSKLGLPADVQKYN